jgi:iron complex outermembrane recepter protein
VTSRLTDKLAFRRRPSFGAAGAVIILFSAVAIFIPAAASADTISVNEAKTDTLIVTGTRHALGEQLRPIVAGRDIKSVLDYSPFTMIRKGASCCTDLYSDGFKRHDITVSVDGERFTTACPNRMDTRVGQINMLDIERIDLSRNGTGLQSGLGGIVEFRRRQPGQDARIYGQVSGSLDHAEDYDASLAVESGYTRLTGRIRQGAPWTDANGRTFSEMYGFKGEDTYTSGELRAHRSWDGGDASASWESSRDLLFPYLLMDERENEHYQASVSHRGHRLYINRTEHLMDNRLRRSGNMSVMVTDATNTMIGLVGDRYEVYARNWNADNTITPLANPAMGKINHMLPDVWRTYASVRHDFDDALPFELSLRAGLARTAIDDDAQLDEYRVLYPDAESSEWSLPFGATASHAVELNETTFLGLSAEVSSEGPGIEQLYIAVNKPGGKPTWLGNPGLKDPVRATLRTGLQRSSLQLEVFTTRVWNYPNLVKRSAGGAMYQTYEGVGALLAGASLYTSWRYLDLGVNWNWGEKTADTTPLSEVQPLVFSLTARTPRAGAFHGRVQYEHATGQDRVDQALDEITTHAWDRVDLAVFVEADQARLTLEVVNLFNELYTEHLSYLRNPFSAGLQVFEPGRTVRAVTTFEF